LVTLPQPKGNSLLWGATKNLVIRQTVFCYANNEILRLRYASAQNDNFLLPLDQ
jgi:hypothetical protein